MGSALPGSGPTSAQKHPLVPYGQCEVPAAPVVPWVAIAHGEE